MFDQAQLRKGTLEGCILKIIDREPTYGYAIATTLRDSGFADLTEAHSIPCCCGSSARADCRRVPRGFRRAEPQILPPDPRRGAVP